MHLPPEALYRRQILQAYNWLDFSGLGLGPHTPEAIRLDQVFVPPQLMWQRVVRQQSPAGWREATVPEPIGVNDALALGNLLITGEPGAGKSTLLRWLAIRFAGSSGTLAPAPQTPSLPLLVELGRLPEKYLRVDSQEVIAWPLLLPTLLVSQPLFSQTSAATLARSLAAGECIVLFDGLDEVAEPFARTRIGRSIAEFTRHTANRVIVSSREGGVRESEGALLSVFEHCRIGRFTPSAILQFFRSLYATSAPHAESERLALGLYERLQASPDLLDAVSNPLLAAVSALIWSTEGSLPAQRVTLYERYCRIMIQDWEQHHSVSYVGKLASVGWQTQLRLLAIVAFQVHSGGLRNGATADGIVPHLARALQEEGVCGNTAQARWEAEQFLAALSVRSGLLQRQGADLYDFPHRIFQEYLTARHIATFDPDRCTDLLMGHLHEEWWREVHLLAVGHLGSEGSTGSRPVRLIQSLLRAYAPQGASRLPKRARGIAREASVAGRPREAARRGSGARVRVRRAGVPGVCTGTGARGGAGALCPRRIGDRPYGSRSVAVSGTRHRSGGFRPVAGARARSDRSVAPAFPKRPRLAHARCGGGPLGQSVLSNRRSPRGVDRDAE